MISVEQLGKIYAGNPRPALDNITLTIPDGAIYGILGRSGAGKSTLIRCLNLLERPTSGRIMLDGRDLMTLTAAELRLQRQRTGMIFQHFNLLHAKTVAENIAVPLEIAGVKKTERLARVAELLALVGLSDRRDAWPSQLSGGQKQRVVLHALWRRNRTICCAMKQPVRWTRKPPAQFWRCWTTLIASLG